MLATALEKLHARWQQRETEMPKIDPPQKNLPPLERAKRLRMVANLPGVSPEKKARCLHMATVMEKLHALREQRAKEAAGKEK